MHRTCPACGSHEGGCRITDVALRAPDGHPLAGGYTVRSCAACGAGFADVQPPTAYYDDHYGRLAKYADEGALRRRRGAMAGGPTAPADPAWVAAKVDETVARLLPLLPSRHARVLDVGCATGGLLAGFARAGFRELWGIDPSPRSVQLASARRHVNAVVGGLGALPDELGAFDCICLTSVLEHVWDPAGGLRSLLAHLRDGGFLYVEVPDAARYLRPFVAPFEDFNTEHINHFSTATLRALAHRLGLGTVSETAYLVPMTSTALSAHLAVVWSPSCPRSPAVGRDEALEASLVGYARRSRRELARLDRGLDRHLGDDATFALWGLGEAAYKLLALPSLASRKAVALADANPARRALRFAGMPVTTPDRLLDYSATVIASSLIRAEAIVESARELGLPGIVRLDGRVPEEVAFKTAGRCAVMAG